MSAATMFEEALRRIIREEVRGALAEVRSADPGWVDQAASPLGRKHNAVVRRRLARGETGAAIVSRRHWLSPDALAEELSRASSKRDKGAVPAASGVRDELRRELAFVRGGR